MASRERQTGRKADGLGRDVGPRNESHLVSGRVERAVSQQGSFAVQAIRRDTFAGDVVPDGVVDSGVVEGRASELDMFQLRALKPGPSESRRAQIDWMLGRACDDGVAKVGAAQVDADQGDVVACSVRTQSQGEQCFAQTLPVRLAPSRERLEQPWSLWVRFQELTQEFQGLLAWRRGAPAAGIVPIQAADQPGCQKVLAHGRVGEAEGAPAALVLPHQERSSVQVVGQYGRVFALVLEHQALSVDEISKPASKVLDAG